MKIKIKGILDVLKDMGIEIILKSQHLEKEFYDYFSEKGLHDPTLPDGILYLELRKGGTTLSSKVFFDIQENKRDLIFGYDAHKLLEQYLEKFLIQQIIQNKQKE